MTFFPIWVWAEPVDFETARLYATNFFNQQSFAQGKTKKSPSKERQMQLLYTQQELHDEAPLLYVFGLDDSEGYVVIAGEDAAIAPVLGYSRTSIFNPDSIPCCLRDWLDEYGRQLAYARESPTLKKVSANNESKRTISPLITTKWSQDTPFNNLCPIDPSTGKRSVTGCVATSIAQIMYYYKWPIQGAGSHSYEWEGQTLTADFGSTTYQWDKMKDTYSENDDDPNNAMATLMYHCGVAVEMQYGSSSSSNGIGLDGSIWTEHFNYSASTINVAIGGLIGDKIEDILYNELCEKRPVWVSGFPRSGSFGHMFICDGYDNGYFHFNFGWGGAYDDYYLLSAITPGRNDFSYRHGFIYGIQPCEKFSVDGVCYELFPNGTAHILTGTIVGEFTIPSFIQKNGKKYNVTGIAKESFKNCSTLTSLHIPTSIKFIGDYAFAGCENLTSVVIPSSVTSIGFQPFNGTKLTSVTIEINDLSSWCSNPLFSSLLIGCSSSDTRYLSMNNKIIHELVIPDDVTSIKDAAFSHCCTLTSVTIPNSVTSIEDEAFSYCGDLTSVTIPNSVISIGNKAFSHCSSLNSATIPNSVKSIGEGAFEYCRNLESIAISNGVTSIGFGAFANCSNLTSVSLPNSITSIDDATFDECRSLTSVTIPNSVTSIGYRAFYGCSNLTSMTIPNSVKSIGSYAFYNCTRLKNVTIEIVDLASWCTKPSLLSRFSCTINFSMNGKAILDLSIPDNVKSISNNAFKACKDLVSLTIPNSVKSIGKSAFQDCISLTTIRTKIRHPFVLGSMAFNGISPSCVLTVPYKKRETYINAGWTEDIFKGGIVEAEYDSEADYVTPGDANGDGVIDVTDIVSIANYILGSFSNMFEIVAADVNGDCVVDVTDIVAVANTILHNGKINNADVRAILDILQPQ